MPKSLLIISYIFFPILVFGQSLEVLTPLSDVVSESSSLIYLNDKLITNNDSGGLPELYEIDSVTGNITRTVTIANAQNVDWEALCFDTEYIYIGDFGNNNGSRTDLKIYRISQESFFNTPDNTVSAEIISFQYSDQTDFSDAPLQTNFDAEAFIALGDSLYIFTKNWLDHRTNIYPVSNVPGNYELSRTDSIDVEGLVTDATYNELNGSIMLSCYTLGSPFAFQISDFSNVFFSEGSLQSIPLQAPSGYSYQIEGIAGINSGLYYFSSEENFLGASGLYKMEITATNILKRYASENVSLFPNPAAETVTIQSDNAENLIIYNTSGQIVDKVVPGVVDVANYKSGIYLVKFLNSKNEVIAVKKLLIP